MALIRVILFAVVALLAGLSPAAAIDIAGAHGKTIRFDIPAGYCIADLAIDDVSAWTSLLESMRPGISVKAIFFDCGYTQGAPLQAVGFLGIVTDNPLPSF